MLFDRHRAHLVHTEMMHAWTTAAVINNAPFNRSEPASPLQFMPNHAEFAASVKAEKMAALTEEEREAVTEWGFKRDQLAAEMRAGKGLLLDKVMRGEPI